MDLSLPVSKAPFSSNILWCYEDPLEKQPTRAISYSMGLWNKQCNQGSHTSQCTSPNSTNKLSQNQAGSNDFNMGMKALFYLADMKDSFFIGNTMGIVETYVFLPIMRTWHLICKYTVVSEHSGLANQSWVWFWECKTCCVDTSWPPESSMHPARGTFGSTNKLKKGRLPFSPCSLEHRFYSKFYTSKIHSSASSTVTLASSLCLLEHGTWYIQEAECKHGYQVPTWSNDFPVVEHKKPGSSDWLVLPVVGYPHRWLCVI